MEKSLILLQREFKDSLVHIINNSKLPAFVIAPILSQALAEVERIEEQQYKAELKAYKEENNGETTETC